jgi:hypothetical protein
MLSRNVKIKIKKHIACGFVWLWNFVSSIQGRICEQDAKEVISTEKGSNNRNLERSA